MSYVKVTLEAVKAEKELYIKLREQSKSLEEAVRSLEYELERNKDGLGAHFYEIEKLVLRLGDRTRRFSEIKDLQRKLCLSIANRKYHIKTDFPKRSVGASDIEKRNYIEKKVLSMFKDNYNRKWDSQTLDEQASENRNDEAEFVEEY